MYNSLPHIQVNMSTHRDGVRIKKLELEVHRWQQRKRKERIRVRVGEGGREWARNEPVEIPPQRSGNETEVGPPAGGKRRSVKG